MCPRLTKIIKNVKKTFSAQAQQVFGIFSRSMLGIDNENRNQKKFLFPIRRKKL